MEDENEVFIGSGNVFADLDLPDPEELQLKAGLAIQIRRVMHDKRLTPAQAAGKMGLDTDAFARLQEGPSSDFTVYQLFHYLNCLGRSVEVRLSPEETEPEKARTLLVAA